MPYAAEPKLTPFRVIGRAPNGMILTAWETERKPFEHRDKTLILVNEKGEVKKLASKVPGWASVMADGRLLAEHMGMDAETLIADPASGKITVPETLNPRLKLIPFLVFSGFAFVAILETLIVVATR